MPSRTVNFRRTRSTGLIANLWIFHPDNNRWRKLVFEGDKASATLKTGQPYTLDWVLLGKPDDELKVTRKTEGVDADFVTLLGSSKIPADADQTSARGVLRTHRDALNFTIS